MFTFRNKKSLFLDHKEHSGLFKTRYRFFFKSSKKDLDNKKKKALIAKKRPLSPHISRYKGELNSLLSISKRILSVFNFITLAILAYFLHFGKEGLIEIFQCPNYEEIYFLLIVYLGALFSLEISSVLFKVFPLLANFMISCLVHRGTIAFFHKLFSSVLNLIFFILR